MVSSCCARAGVDAVVRVRSFRRLQEVCRAAAPSTRFTYLHAHRHFAGFLAARLGRAPEPTDLTEEALLDFRDGLEREPERYGAWAARWASRFVHEADVDEAALVLAALIALRARARLAAGAQGAL